MKIIIMGAGKVGFQIADILAKEGHNLTIIENEKEKVEQAQEKIDAMVIYGDGASEEILLSAGIAKADLFIAATNRDEVNILGCLLAKEYEVTYKIARIRNMGYSKAIGKINPEKLGIDFLINPRNVLSNEICNLVTYLNANDAAEFANGEVVFISYTITKDNPIAGFRINEFVTMAHGVGFVIMSIRRDGEIFIPKGNDLIKPNDVVSIVCCKKDHTYIKHSFGFNGDKAKKVFILGAGEIGVEVAKRLTARKYTVTLIDHNPIQCERASQMLPDNVLILCSDNTDAETLKAEGLDHADIFIAVTDNDQTNILGSLLARSSGVKKAFTVVNKPDLLNLAKSLDMNTLVNPRLATASAILKCIRGEMVLNIAKLNFNDAEVIEFKIPDSSPIIDVPMKDLPMPKGVKVGAILRKNGKLVIPSGDDIFKAEDNVITMCLADVIPKAKEFFS